MQQNEKIEFFNNLTFKQACLVVGAYQVKERQERFTLNPELHLDLYKTYQQLPQAIKDILEIRIVRMSNYGKITDAVTGAEQPSKCCIQ